MNVVFDDSVEDWVAERIPGCSRGFDPCRSAGVYDGELIAGVVFHNWNPEAGVIEISSAAVSPKWAQRHVLKELFAYPFGFCQAAVARISEHNTRARRLWRAFGADEHIIPRLRGMNEAEALYVLRKEAWEASPFMR